MTCIAPPPVASRIGLDGLRAAGDRVRGAELARELELLGDDVDRDERARPRRPARPAARRARRRRDRSTATLSPWRRSARCSARRRPRSAQRSRTARRSRTAGRDRRAPRSARRPRRGRRRPRRRGGDAGRRWRRRPSGARPRAASRRCSPPLPARTARARPARQGSQSPQVGTKARTTWSPTSKPETPVADLDDLARRLVAEHHRHHARARAVDDREVGVAEAGGADAHQELARPGPGQVELDDLERARLARRAPAAPSPCSTAPRTFMLPPRRRAARAPRAAAAGSRAAAASRGRRTRARTSPSRSPAPRPRGTARSRSARSSCPRCPTRSAASTVSGNATAARNWQCDSAHSPIASPAWMSSPPSLDQPAVDHRVEEGVVLDVVDVPVDVVVRPARRDRIEVREVRAGGCVCVSHAPGRYRSQGFSQLSPICGPNCENPPVVRLPAHERAHADRNARRARRRQHHLRCTGRAGARAHRRDPADPQCVPGRARGSGARGGRRDRRAPRGG